MAHRAEVIMEAVKTALTGLTTTETRVYRERQYDLEQTELPALKLFMGPDSPISDNDTGGPTNYTFQDSYLFVIVQAHVESITDELETTLNLIRREVHVAMRTDYKLGLAYVMDTIWNGAEQPDLIKEGDKPSGSLDLNWIIRYRALIADPEE